MSEQDRARLYAWLREHAGESEAEYLMSCLAPAPLSDLVTKDYLDATLDRVLDKKLDEKLDEKLSNYVTKDYFEARREADRKEATHRHRVLIGAVSSMFVGTIGVLIAAMYGIVSIAVT